MTATTQPVRPAHGLLAIVGFLVCVELASGVLQGYYTPIYSDIADHLSIKDADVNWFEAAQLVVSALVVPPLCRLGDLVGHKKVLLLSTAVTALGSWVLAIAPGFTTAARPPISSSMNDARGASARSAEVTTDKRRFMPTTLEPDHGSFCRIVTAGPVWLRTFTGRTFHWCVLPRA